MRAGMEKRATEAWYQDAVAALEAEQAGQFKTDEELSELVFRELPLYFAHFGTVEAGYLDSLRTEVINGDALRPFNNEIFTTFDLRSELSNITSPTLVITGDEDFIIGGARVVVVGDAGHFLVVEQPQSFHDEVADLVAAD